VSERYRFWKKINNHPLFLCPVEKMCSNEQITVLPCGHIFSSKTIKKLNNAITPEFEFKISVNNGFTTQFTECLWCESIQEIVNPCILVLGTNFSIENSFL